MASEADAGFWRHVVEWAWAPVSALIGVVWKMLNERIDAVDNHVDEVYRAHTDEMNRQRDNIAKIFDKLEANSQRAEDRHRELLTALHTGLAGKVDR